MENVEAGRLIYLVLLGGAIAGYFLLNNRHRLGTVAQQGAIWGLIFLGVIAAVGLWPDIRATVAPQQSVLTDQGRIVLPQARDGHYYLRAEVNGTPVNFIVDTGATNLVLSQRDADRVGIDPTKLHYSGRAGTANGAVQTAPVRLSSFAIGPLRDEGVRASVNGGEMRTSLLGMSYLQRFASIRISDGELVLER